MAVSKSQPWITETSGDPSGTVTIGGGTNRCLILIRGIEHNTASASASCAIGNVNATGRGVSSMSDGGEVQQVVYFYWDESDLESMSGNTISFSDGVVQSKTFWTYATFASVDQTNVLIAGATTGTATSASPFRMPTVGASGDWSICHMVTNASSSYEWDANITENFDVSLLSTFSYTMADGSWNGNFHEARPRIVSTDVVGQGIVLKSLGADGGVGNPTAPSVTVAGSGDVDPNKLVPPIMVVSGVGERVIVWQGGVDLIAPNATSSADISFNIFFGSGSAEPQIFEVTGVGKRGSNGTGSAVAPLPVLTSYSPDDILGTGSCEAPQPLVSGTDFFDALWYTSKQVYFLGV